MTPPPPHTHSWLGDSSIAVESCRKRWLEGGGCSGGSLCELHPPIQAVHHLQLTVGLSSTCWLPRVPARRGPRHADGPSTLQQGSTMRLHPRAKSSDSSLKLLVQTMSGYVFPWHSRKDILLGAGVNTRPQALSIFNSMVLLAWKISLDCEPLL